MCNWSDRSFTVTVVATPQQDLLALSVARTVTRWCDELTASGGTLREQSGAVTGAIGHPLLSIESIYGPAEQAKTTNQDAALLWLPSGSPTIRWAAAVADGLSRSLYASLASRLACYAAITALERCDARRIRLRPFPPCQNLFSKLGRQIRANPEQFQPADCFPATWARVLRDGRFLQTTLMVVWATDSQIHVVSLGDGGIVVQCEGCRSPIVFVPATDSPVNCLGPSPPVRPTELELAVPTDRCQRLCVFTDGVSPVMQSNPEFALQILTRSITRQRANSAADVLRFLAYSGVAPAADNLSLFAMAGGD